MRVHVKICDHQQLESKRTSICASTEAQLRDQKITVISSHFPSLHRLTFNPLPSVPPVISDSDAEEADEAEDCCSETDCEEEVECCSFFGCSIRVDEMQHEGRVADRVDRGAGVNPEGGIVSADLR